MLRMEERPTWSGWKGWQSKLPEWQEPVRQRLPNFSGPKHVQGSLLTGRVWGELLLETLMPSIILEWAQVI